MPEIQAAGAARERRIWFPESDARAVASGPAPRDGVCDTNNSARQGNTPDRALFKGENGMPLYVVVQSELERMRTQGHGLDLLVHLVLNPCLNHVFREDIPAQEEVMIPLQGVESFVE